MGLLSLGTPLDWHDSRKHNEHVRDHGIVQLIHMFEQHASRQNDKYLWGDEVEYMLVDINNEEKTATLSIDKDNIISDLNDPEKSLHKSVENNISFHPEYGRYMLEATPATPYDGTRIDDYAYVEQNMIARRKVSEAELPSHIRPLTLTTFPRMGCPGFTSPSAKPIGPASQSLFLPDEIINRHVRFPTLTANIRKRRGCKVAINLPVYPDVNTKLLDDSIPRDRDLFDSDKEPFLGASKPGHIYMDSMGFGMGSSCLQVTMQASDIDEARYLYDSLAPITPVLLSLSAAAPIFKGYLVNQDVRWNVVSGAVDDRTFYERGVEAYPGYNALGGLDVENGELNIKEGGKLETRDGKPIQRVPKSRYDSIDNYLGDINYGTNYFDPKFNDIYSPVNEKVLHKLRNEYPQLFDQYLAQHFAHLFIRDPLVLFSERINQDDKLENDHFENIQSTNWQTLRFKPPALYKEGTDLATTPGWRVEFRPLEIQLTDFENAAYSNFISLLSKAIIKFKPNLYIPISKIDENMNTAHKVDSVLNDTFWFRTIDSWNLSNSDFVGYNLTWFDRYLNLGNDELENNEVYINGYSRNGAIVNTENGFSDAHRDIPAANGTENGPSGTSAKVGKYTVNEIINGNDKFPGLIKLIVRVIATDLVPAEEGHCKSDDLAKNLIRIKHYLMLISQRASGKIPTAAHWLRQTVLNSELYNKDSKVGSELNYRLVHQAVAVTELSDKKLVQSLLGEGVTEYLCR